MKNEEKKPYRNDLSGKNFNRLTVVSYSHTDKNNGAVWNCICDCGKTTKVSTSRLSKGYTKSCGCLQREASAESVRSHGMYKTTLYRRWSMMKKRCKDKNDPIYGGKGISYCEEWEHFENFYNDMHEGFSKDLELDRIDVTGNYCKENCRWVTHNENNYNKNLQSNSTTGRTGVSFRKEMDKYRAYITVNRKQINLGLFETFEEACRAREQAEIEYYGYNRP